jgi:hypothetical protein
VTDETESGDARTTRLRQSLADRYARLEQGRRTGFFVAVGRRFIDIDGFVYATLVTIELFTTVLPLIILGFGYFSGFANDASLGTIFIRQLNLHGAVEDNVRAAFGSAAGLKSSWTIVGMAGFLIWGIPMAITVAGMFAEAWRREQFTLLQRMWRGAVWFVLYLTTLVLHDRIGYHGHHSGGARVLLYLISLIPTWLFWTWTPVLLVRDGGRGARFLAKAGLAGLIIDGVILTLAARIVFPSLLSGWTGFGPIGVAMAIMTWCGVLGIGWVATACVSAVLWERSAPPATVIAAQTDPD